MAEGEKECQLCKELTLQTAFCKSCGTAIPARDTFCHLCKHNTVQIEPSISPPRRSTRRNKWLIFIALVLILITGGGGYGYYYVKDASSPSHTTQPFIQSILDNDAATLSDLLKEANPSLNELKVSKLLSDLHSHPTVLDQALENMKQQELLINTSENTDPFLFQLKKMPEKKWLFIDQFSIDLLPVSFSLETDREADVYLNERELKQTGTTLREVQEELPGTFYVTAYKEGEYGKFEVIEEFTVWKTTSEPLPVYFEEEYVTVTSDSEGAEVFLNGELHGKIKGPDMKIGPVSSGEEITISGKYSYPWGDVFSEEFQVSGAETVELSFPPNYSFIRQEVMSDIVSYNTSYIEAITRVDASLLHNVKGNLLREMKKTITNLQKRNIHYGGRLNDMVFDGQSFTFEEKNGTYYASIKVEERYSSSWIDPADPSAADIIPKKYFFTYYCEYHPSENEWYVTDSKEHTSLVIKEPL